MVYCRSMAERVNVNWLGVVNIADMSRLGL